MPPVTRSSENYTAADKCDVTAEKVDALAEEWDVAKKMAEERHQAIQSQLAELTRLVTESQNIHHRQHSSDHVGTLQHIPVSNSHLEQNRHDNSVENNGFRETFGNRDSMLKKVDMPIFEGVDAYAWFNLVERFFELGKYNDTEKLELVSVSLTGRVLSWYNWEVRRVPFTSWADFKHKMLRRFGLGRSLSPKEKLFSLKQEGGIEDYVHEFEDLSSQIDDLDDESLEYIFKKGLKPELLALVDMLEPQGLTAMINKALGMEINVLSRMVGGALSMENYGTLVPYVAQPRAKPYTPAVVTWKKKPLQLENEEKHVVKKANQVQNGRERGKLNLSPEEYEERRKKRLCFRCNEKYFPGHNCPNKELQVLLVVNGCELELLQEEDEEVQGEEILLKPHMMQLSFNAFLGMDSPTTTKIKGKIGKVDFTIMLDSGATHNFISPS